jgi:hypothetical protein
MEPKEKKEDVVVAPVEKKEEPKAKDDSEKTYEELKAEAEAAEIKAKELKENETEEEKRQNMIIRRNKALGKTEKSDLKVETKSDDLDTRDLITLGKHDISENSEKAKVLEKYKKGGIIKDYAEGLNHLGIKAEFDALDAKTSAKNVIDENDTDEVKVKTTKEIVNSYRNNGTVPTDKKAIKAIADDNLKQMGL